MHTYILRVWINGIQPQESRYRVSGIAVPENWNGGAIWAGFFKNYELHNRAMHISRMLEEVDIENQLKAFSDTISEKTINHAIEIFSKCGKDDYFGRTIVEEITGLKPSGASKLIKLLSESKVIIPVTGHGKGKYRFK